MHYRKTPKFPKREIGGRGLIPAVALYSSRSSFSSSQATGKVYSADYVASIVNSKFN